MKNGMSLRMIVVAASLVLMSGCAPLISGAMNAGVDDKAVAEKTAKYFGTSAQKLSISSVEKGALTTSYQARYAGKLYNCTIYYGEVDCKQPGGAQAAQDRGNVSKTSESMTARQAQVRLNDLGFSVGPADGVFGSKSVAQLKRFQSARGLVATGKLDDATVASLRQVD